MLVDFHPALFLIALNSCGDVFSRRLLVAAAPRKSIFLVS